MSGLCQCQGHPLSSLRLEYRDFSVRVVSVSGLFQIHLYGWFTGISVSGLCQFQDYPHLSPRLVYRNVSVRVVSVSGLSTFVSKAGIQEFQCQDYPTSSLRLVYSNFSVRTNQFRL